MSALRQRILRLLNRSRVKGSSLFFAVVFAIIVLSLAFLIQLSQNSYFYVYSDYAQQQSLSLCVASAATIDRADSLPVVTPQYRLLDVFQDQDSRPVAVTRQRWGGFEIQKLYGQSKQYSKRKAYLLGQNFFSQADQRALYVADMDKPVIFAGGATVAGSAVVPNDGLFPGNIDGQYFRFKSLVEGNISATSASLPAIDAGLLDFWRQCKSGAIQRRDSVQIANPATLVKGANAYSFFGPTALFIFQGAVALNDVALAGNAIVMATDRVVIPSTCTLDNVVVFARKITVESGFTGRAQLFASDTITVAGGVALGYPSVAMVVVESAAKHKGAIILDKGAVLSGALILCDERATDLFSLSAADIASGAAVNGMVYCNGMLSHAGKVNGSVYTKYFYVKRYSGFYINYLVDGAISFPKLSPHFCAPFVLGERYKKAVVEELW